uniref:YadA C-terminal domain-containing protein n=1 Tax=uncultured Fusobacterium sp. TaxID=159267 RepID=UPI0025FC1990
FATKGEVNDAYAKAEAVEKENVRVNKEQDAAIAGKVDKNEFYDKYNELHMGQTFTDETLKTHREQIEALDKNKVDKNTYEEDKKAQAETDKKQDAAIAGKVDKNEFYDKYNELHMGQTFTDETLKTHREQIEALDKNKVDKNTYEEDKKAQAETDKKQDQALKDETTAREEADKVLGGRIDTLQQDFAKYDGRLSGLEKKVDNLDNKMNKGLSLMAAMNAVDFQNVQTGEMALGAGIGHYGNAQSVALGVAYSPVEDLTVNAKYSVTAGDVDSFALGAGATYKFKVGR